MHELLVGVVEQRDLSKAGQLFKVSDWDIVNDLDEALTQLKEIFCSKTYENDDNCQSVVEICLARITSAIRETRTIEKYAPGLVDMLEACLNHKISSDTPHTKIASDLLSCIFLHYGSKSVMTVAIPVAVKALNKGNGDLVRNTSSYLALAAIHNARLLANFALPIIESIAMGNYSLIRVLPQIYSEKRETIQAHLSSLIDVLDECDQSEKLSLLQLCSMIANTKPELLVPYVTKLTPCLTSQNMSSGVLHIFLSFITGGLTHVLCDHLAALKKTADATSASNLPTIAKIVAAIARCNKTYTQECVSYLVVQCYRADATTFPVLIREIESISEVYPEYVQPFVSQIYKLSEDSNNANARSIYRRIRDYCSEDEATRIRLRTPSSSEKITVISVNEYCSKESLDSHKAVVPRTNKLNNDDITQLTGMAKFVVTGRNNPVNQNATVKYNLSRPKSRSHGNLSTSNRQLTTITINRDLLKALPPSPVLKPTINGSQLSNDSGLANPIEPPMLPRRTPIRIGQSPGVKRHVNSAALHNRNSLFVLGSSGGYQVQYINSKGRIRVNPSSRNTSSGVTDSPKLTGSHVVTTFYPNQSISQKTGSGSTLYNFDQSTCIDPRGKDMAHPVPTRDAQTQSSATLDSKNHYGSILQQLQHQETQQQNRGDAVLQFCEKHKYKIKDFANDFCTRYPIPTQCTVEESGHKQRIRVHFNCQEQGDHCLYTYGNLFVFKTRFPHLWLHLMFLHVQAQSASTLGQNHDQVKQLKSCWDYVPNSISKHLSFIALVTSAFPAVKEQQQLLKELQMNRYYDVFAYNALKNKWACFPCNHPDKVHSFLTLNPNNPLIEGQLKEKKGRWKLFKRWHTRYFTLSGASLSYKGNHQVDEANPIIDLRSIKSVKSVSKRKGRRTLPKAFEIFTHDDVTSYVLKAKDRKNAEEWFQCLQIAIAQAHREPQVQVSAL